MLARLIVLLTVVPLIELALLLRLASWLRLGPTVALVLLTGVLGAYLARRAGIKALARIQSELAQGVMPADELVNGVLILAAGLLLVTPGILTDLLGFGLLFAPVRVRVRRRMVEAFKRRVVMVDGCAAEPFVDVVATSASNVAPFESSPRCLDSPGPGPEHP